MQKILSTFQKDTTLVEDVETYFVPVGKEDKKLKIKEDDVVDSHNDYTNDSTVDVMPSDEIRPFDKQIVIYATRAAEVTEIKEGLPWRHRLMLSLLVYF